MNANPDEPTDFIITQRGRTLSLKISKKYDAT